MEIYINNLRSFQKESLKFSRVNILIGENSGGKSSLLKFLMILKQSLSSPNESNLKLSGPYADMGNYKEAVYRNAKNRRIQFAFTIGNEYFEYFVKDFMTEFNDLEKNEFKRIVKIIQPFLDSQTKVEYDLSAKLDDHSDIRTTFTNDKIGKLVLKVGKRSKSDAFSRYEYLCDIHYDIGGKTGVLKECSFLKEGFMSMIHSHDLFQKCESSFGRNAKKYYYLIAYLLVIQNYLSDQFKRLKYANPLSSNPKRLYFQSDSKASYQVMDMERVINLLSTKVQNKRNRELRKINLSKLLKSMGIADEIEVVEDPNLMVSALKVKHKGTWNNITDVGFGVSLQVPILFQAYLSEILTSKGETVIIEQPEVHLHPKLHANFIETLLGIGKRNKYFIETHSEHIVRKLQVLIKNKTFDLQPSDISIHYFQKESQQFVITSHTIDVNGNIKPPFPDGFFDNSYNLVLELL